MGKIERRNRKYGAAWVFFRTGQILNKRGTIIPRSTEERIRVRLDEVRRAVELAGPPEKPIFPSRKKLRNLRNRVTKENRDRLWVESGGDCEYCGKGMTRLPHDTPGVRLNDIFTVDHFIPLSRGGTNNINNLRASCWQCNHEKDRTK